MDNKLWYLPEGIDELLPIQAERVEQVRLRIFDLYRSWGYQLVIPPFIEFIDSLLTGTGRDLDLQTFKLTDQISGRTMGVRADITPQVARIDANKLRTDAPTRLYYIGTVLRARPGLLGATRSPLQVGAELFGHNGAESDIEILLLMLETLQKAGLSHVHFDLGHVGIYRGLAKQANLNREQELALFDALQRKAIPEIEKLVRCFNIKRDLAKMLLSLAELNGGEEMLARARSILVKASNTVHSAIDYVEQVAASVVTRSNNISIHYDLAELRSYHYKTGIIFAAFAPGCGAEIARGGRYNDVGRAFGRARPATGFSIDLKALVQIISEPPDQIKPVTKGILAPWNEDAQLIELVAELRLAGEKIVWELPGQQGGAKAVGCSRIIKHNGKRWLVDIV